MVSSSSKGKGYAIVGLAIAALLIASLLLYQTYFTGGEGNPGPITSSTQSLGQKQVASRIHVFVNDLSNLDAQNLTSLYASTAVLSWSGKGIDSTSPSSPFSLNGRYHGENISRLYATVLAQLEQPHPVAVVYYSAQATMSGLATVSVAPSVVNATFRLMTSDYTAGFGFVNATIYIQQQWTNQTISGGGSAWYINSDFWNFTSVSVQYPNH